MLIHLTQKGRIMAEEKATRKYQPGPDDGMTRDDILSLRYILRNVKGSSPSSFIGLAVESDELLAH